MMRKIVIFVSGAFFCCAAWGQCAPGIPGAGNPGCIPPTQPGSPYYQGSDQPPVATLPAARWADRWGAVAIDPSGRAGVITGLPSKAAAEREALRKCQANQGTACAIAVSYYNQCAAIAQKPSGGVMGTSTGPTVDVAKSTALEQCGDSSCHVVYSACSMAERID